MAEKAIHAVITGRVQGVFFRVFTQEQALHYGLSGWVRNRPDGSVEAFISGDADQVDRMVSWLHQGPPSSRVDEIVVDVRQADSSLLGFEILY